MNAYLCLSNLEIISTSLETITASASTTKPSSHSPLIANNPMTTTIPAQANGLLLRLLMRKAYHF